MLHKNRFGACRADLTLSLALLLFAGTFVLAAAVKMNEEDARKKCASNLRMLGQALLLYSNENRGAYPRTVAEKNAAAPKPVWGTPYEQDKQLGSSAKAEPFANATTGGVEFRPAANDVTAALFLLLRTQEVTSEAFVCPSTQQKLWDFGGGANTALNWTNWKGNEGIRTYLSYSYQNPYPSASAIGSGFRLNNSIGAEFVVLSDINSGSKDLLTVRMTDGKEKMAAVNSPNHGGDGQNVLYGDGHVEFVVSPFVGVQRDNIFTYGASGTSKPDSAGEGIVGSPVNANDSILLPTATDVGIPMPQPATKPAK